MNMVLSAGLEAVAAGIVLTPLFLIFNKYRFQSMRKTLFYLTFALYLSAVYALVGLPNVLYIRFDLHLNFVPFAYMFSAFLTSFLNVVLFFPLGVFLPLFWETFRKWHNTMLFGFCMSLFIEVMQIFTYRATDINDLITNTFGTLLGYIAARIILKLSPVFSAETQKNNLLIICSFVLLVMFFVQPFISNLLWGIIL